MNMTTIAGLDASHHGQTRDAVAPNSHIVLVIADDDRLTGGAGRSVELDDLLERHGEQAVRIGIAKNGLVGKGKLSHIVKGLDIGRLHTHLIHFGAIPFNLVVDHGNLLLELLKLHRMELFPA